MTILFFDNHPGCDSGSYKEHEAKVQEFFKTGKIVVLRKENVRVFKSDEMACITMNLRYSSAPGPGVRSTYIVECVSGEWKLRHMHHSFDPIQLA